MPSILENEYLAEELPDALWRLDVDRYHDLIRHGAFSHDDRLELLDGCLVKKMTLGPVHTTLSSRIRRFLDSVLKRGHFMEPGHPVTIPPLNEPEPDIVVIRGVHDDFIHKHPGPADVPLIIEVSDSSLRRDRGWKASIYARAGIPEYWIVNANAETIEIRTQPVGGIYQDIQIVGIGSEVPLCLQGQEIARLDLAQLFHMVKPAAPPT